MTNAAGPVEPTDAGEGNGSGKWIKTSRNALAWILLAVAGFLLNDAYSWARDKTMDKPDYLQELARDQEQQFKALKDSLGKISSSIDSGDRAAFKQVKDAVSAMGDTNASLIQQLVLAKQENETLRRIAGDKAGVSGGYDFILAEGSGIRVDRDTILGVERIDTHGALVNLASGNTEQVKNERLTPGEALAFTNPQGKQCKVSLLSFNDAAVGTASFAVGCT